MNQNHRGCNLRCNPRNHYKICRRWMAKINVLRVNLDNPNVKVDTLTNSESIKNLTNVKKLAESSGAVAAINASFFSWLSESGKGDPIGPIIQSGEVLSIDTEFNSTTIPWRLWQ